MRHNGIKGRGYTAPKIKRPIGEIIKEWATVIAGGIVLMLGGLLILLIVIAKLLFLACCFALPFLAAWWLWTNI